MAALIFIDTNIYLDFYRFTGIDTNLSILKHFDTNHDHIITTTEVEMEYKNNRQRVILESVNNLKPVDSSSLNIPAFLKESKSSRVLKKSHKSLVFQSNKLKERTAKLLEYPSRNDPVYKVLQRLFKSKSACHLTRKEKNKHKIREEAKQRFLLGYPPRKRDELSLIDEINWEWIIYCAQKSTYDIVIVTRDSDYGCHYNNRSMLNDWLLQEFKERVSHKRSIILTNRLTEAFKQASIQVSRAEEESESKLIKYKYSLQKEYPKQELSFEFGQEILKPMIGEMFKNITTEALSKMLNELIINKTDKPEEVNSV
jgi:hypothetical protein